MHLQLRKYLAIVFLLSVTTTIKSQTTPAAITVDLKNEIAPMEPVWAWFGYDEPNYTYMKDGKKLLSEIAALSPTPVYVRTHSLLVSGDGVAALKWGSTNAYTEDVKGNPVYNWTIVDSIFDTYVQRGMKPLAQIGFMPEALSSHPVPYRHYWKPGDPYTDIITGWAYPPKDYDKWRNLVYEWVKHCVARYGKKEVESWYWEVWNEPNGHYWKGTQEEFFKMYDYAADGLKKALPTAKIGGINIAGTRTKGALEWTNNFVKHCISGTNYATGKKGSPLEAILFHAKGWPKSVDGVVRMDMAPQLQDIEAGFKLTASYPETEDLPIIIGESDPEGCAACGMATNPENAYRNGTMYSSYTAATFARKYLLADATKVNFLGAVSWSFEFENQPWFYGFRDLATNGVDKPVLNVFRMFGMMTGKRIKAESNRMLPLQEVLKNSVRGAQSDIGALANKDKKSAAVMVWNYHDDDKPGPTEAVSVTITNIPAKSATLTIYMIDKDNSNSYEVWKAMGSPQNPTQEQIATLEKSGQLKSISTKTIKPTLGKAIISLQLARQGVALIKLDW
ncbi:GH39 family glycosyl hydrolase [Flavobacterium subsaxonicum]|uniref:Beta-xylosidase n=1 Tax=Flavobacterium subsaxonicum WB 4.1-42 = DSM 21790 TaxID=1121898 RepID=A0A0A2MK74_9FLAO|nr:beta-xylosidase [Flavobacterium subsaxonicum]KGO92001.1 beta-xylosidase [Flavobacterium subsaxonicum WB 4.1-42 = DSM 21790]